MRRNLKKFGALRVEGRRKEVDESRRKKEEEKRKK